MASRRLPKEIVDLREQPTGKWLDLVFTPEHKRKVGFEHYRFPSDRHAVEALNEAHSWTEQQTKRLLRGFLLRSGTLGHDSRLIHELSSKSNPSFEDDFENIEFVRRLFHLDGPWEGITWVLDLLPSSPVKAIEVVDAYYAAHCQYLPDGRADGLFDAMSVIRRRYFHAQNSREAIAALTPTEFEFLVGALYKAMGHAVRVTRSSKDGGVDIFASRTDSGSRVMVLIQCKHYTRNVAVQAVRELTGLVLKQHANKGVLVSSSDFTGPARAEAYATPTIELLGYSELNVLFNQFLGANWPKSLSYYIRDMQYEYDSQLKALRADA